MVKEVVDPILLSFRKNLADFQGVCSSITYGHKAKGEDLLRWNEARHGLSLATNIKSPNEKNGMAKVSVAHLWDM